RLRALASYPRCARLPHDLPSFPTRRSSDLHHREVLREEFRRVLAGEPPRRFHVEYRAANGRIVVLSGSAQAQREDGWPVATQGIDRKSTRLNSSHVKISYAVSCLKKKTFQA